MLFARFFRPHQLPLCQVPKSLHPGNTPWRERIAGVVAGVEEAAEGIRRGTRKRMKPLEYFRGERVVYGRRESGRFPCPVDVITLPDEPTPPHFRRMRAMA